MRGINGKPFVEMDKFLDIKGLDDIQDEIVFGIAASKDRHWGSYGHGSIDSKYLDVRVAEKQVLALPVGHPDRVWYKALESPHDRRYWLKLKYGAYSGYHSVIVRHSKSYLGKNDPEKCFWTEDSRNFPMLIDWVYSQSTFAKLGRVAFFVTEHDAVTLPHHHVDDGKPGEFVAKEFVWISFNGKTMYVMDERFVPIYFTSRATFFNDGDIHGGDPSPRVTFSLRIDGEFSREVREAIGSDPINPVY